MQIKSAQLALALFTMMGFATSPFADGAQSGSYIVDNVKVYIDPKSFDSTRYLSTPPVGLEE